MYFGKKGELASLIALGLILLVGGILFLRQGGITGAVIGTEGITTQAAYTIFSCQKLNETGATYTLGADVSSTSTCFTILNNSVTLDCNNFKITFATIDPGYAINNTGAEGATGPPKNLDSGFHHVTIDNCIIVDAFDGGSRGAIVFNNVTNSTIRRTRIFLTEISGSTGPNIFAIQLLNSSNNTIIDTNITIGPLVNNINGIILNGTSTGNLILNTNISVYGPGGTRAIQDVADSNTQTTNSLKYNNTLGEINWTKTNLTTNLSLLIRETVFVQNNLTGLLDNPGMLNLNTTAEIQIRSLVYKSLPRIFRNGLFVCDSVSVPICNATTYDPYAGILSFNVSSFSNYTTLAENVSPAVTINNPVATANLSGGLQPFNTTVTDLSNVSAVIFMFNTNTTPFNISATNSSGTSWNANVNISAVVEGAHTVTVFANDTVNNTNNANRSVTVAITVDLMAPNVSNATVQSSLNGQNFSVNSFNQSFNVQLKDYTQLLAAGTGVRNATYSFDNASGTGFNATAVNNSGTWSASYNVSGLAEGNHTVRIFAFDYAANLNNSEIITFEVDFTAPNITIVSPVNGSNYSVNSFDQTFSVLLRDPDSLTDVKNATFSFNNASGTGFNVTAVNNSGSWSASYNVSSLREGSHVMRVYTYDFAGNLNNTETITFDVDFTAPNITIVSPVNGSNYSVNSFNQTFNVSLRDPDSLTDVKNATFAFDNASGTGFNVTAVNGSGYWAAKYNVSGLAEGNHSMRIYTYDFAGNLNNTETIPFDVDFTAPNITIVTPVTGQNFSVRSFNQTFNVSLRDPDALTDVKNATFGFDNSTSPGFNITAVNGSGYWAASYNVSGLAEGNHTLRIYTYDFAGNLNNTETITFTVDFTVPAVNISAPTDGATIFGTRDFNASVKDNLTSVNTVLFQFSNGTSPFNRTATNTSGTWGVSVDTTTIEEGSLIVTVFANDTVGNMNNTETLSLTVDNIAVPSGSGGESSPQASASSGSKPAAEAPTPTEAAESAEVSEVAPIAAEVSAAIGPPSPAGVQTGSLIQIESATVEIYNSGKKPITVSAAIKEDFFLENEENVKKKISDKLAQQGKLSPEKVEEELHALALLEKMEVLQAFTGKKGSFFPLVGLASPVQLIQPTGEHIAANLLKTELINAQDFHALTIQPGERFTGEVKIKRGLSLKPEPVQVVFSSEEGVVLSTEFTDGANILVGTELDLVDKEQSVFDIYVQIPPDQEETYMIELTFNQKKPVTAQIPATKVSSKFASFLPLVFRSGKEGTETAYTDLLGPFKVNQKGALIAAQYQVSTKGTYDIISKTFKGGSELVAENHFQLVLE